MRTTTSRRKSERLWPKNLMTSSVKRSLKCELWSVKWTSGITSVSSVSRLQYQWSSLPAGCDLCIEYLLTRSSRSAELLFARLGCYWDGKLSAGHGCNLKGRELQTPKAQRPDANGQSVKWRGLMLILGLPLASVIFNMYLRFGVLLAFCWRSAGVSINNQINRRQDYNSAWPSPRGEKPPLDGLKWKFALL